jgi:hypothetical protein
MEDVMSDVTKLVDQYIALWNETDGRRRRDLIGQAWTEDGTYVDPLMEGAGLAGIDAMVQGVQDRFPGHRFRRTGDVEQHHDRVRFTWEFAPESGAAIVKGTDFGVLGGDRLRSVTGFFDYVAQPAA